MIAFTTAEPNVPLRIYDGFFEFRGVTGLSVDASVIMSWLPRPRILFGFHTLSENLNTLIHLLGNTRVVDPEGKFFCEQGRRRTHIRFDRDKIYIEIELAKFELVDNSKLNCVLFHIANLDGIYQVGKSSIKPADTITLTGAGWRVEIEATKPRVQKLYEIGGFVVTHLGLLEREDKQPFSRTEATDLLEGLRYFFSFIRGGWCWPCLYFGRNESDCCWFMCDEPKEIDQIGAIDEVPDAKFFAAQHELQVITASFDGYLKFWFDPAWRKPIQTALSWHVESSHARSAETSLLAGQTALELIAWLKVVELEKAISADGFDKLSAADRFKLLLNMQGIPVSFPSSGSELDAYSAKHGWDVPRAITELRNSIVHPRKRQTIYQASEMVRQEARNLTLRYLASAILRLFGYPGELSIEYERIFDPDVTDQMVSDWKRG